MLKAQVLSYDFLLATFVFSAALVLMFSYWNYGTKQIEETRIFHDMVNKLFIASQVWFKSGTPIYWAPDNLIELGLENEGKLNQTKLNYLQELGYQKVISLLPVTPYNLYYRVSDENNLTLFEFGNYPTNAKNILRANRFSILNQTPVLITTLVWT
jgi:hypothetical protein